MLVVLFMRITVVWKVTLEFLLSSSNCQFILAGISRARYWNYTRRIAKKANEILYSETSNSKLIREVVINPKHKDATCHALFNYIIISYVMIPS